MLKQAVAPPDLVATPMGPKLPSQRAVDLQGIVSLPVRDLFGDIAPEMYLPGGDLAVIRQAAEAALSGVDMRMIKPGHKVNLLCSEHGFALNGFGFPGRKQNEECGEQ